MYIAIEGVIGVGKTTLARLLQPAFQASLLLEVFEENPFLTRFYEDRPRYAFQTQMFFLLSRYHQQRRGIPLAEKITVPGLIVYLRADTETLMQRIAQRDRPYERQMERAYIDELNHAYDDFFVGSTQHRSPVLVINCNHLDYVRSLEDLHWTEDRIRQELKLLPYQPELLESRE